MSLSPSPLPPNMPATTYTVPAFLHGSRLIDALGTILPETGTRERKRMFATHIVFINGKRAKKGYTIKEGDTITLQPKTLETPVHTFSPEDLPVICQNNRFGAVYKPSGVHTARIAGKHSKSVEEFLPELFPMASPTPTLINRLDNLTSGMVLVAKTPEAAAVFRTNEDKGTVEKLYLAIVHGKLKTPQNITATLDTAKRKVTKVLQETTPDELRHTAVMPICTLTLPLHHQETIPHPQLTSHASADQTIDEVKAREAEATKVQVPPNSTATLVLCSIHKGARHQIRAHLASTGYPIVGDPLYGKRELPATANSKETIMFLHHYHLEVEEFVATCLPQWPEWAMSQFPASFKKTSSSK